MTTVKRQVWIDVSVCDFCKADRDDHYTFDECVICGRDVCGRHEDAQWTEDGSLCPECHSKYEIVHGSEGAEIDGHPLEWGSVGIVEKSTGRNASHLWQP